MDNPREILNRAGRQAAAAKTVVLRKESADTLPAEAPKYVAVPQPVGGHAIYRNLMRSHDRMATRHVTG